MLGEARRVHLRRMGGPVGPIGSSPVATERVQAVFAALLAFLLLGSVVALAFIGTGGLPAAGRPDPGQQLAADAEAEPVVAAQEPISGTAERGVSNGEASTPPVTLGLAGGGSGAPEGSAAGQGPDGEAPVSTDTGSGGAGDGSSGEGGETVVTSSGGGDGAEKGSSGKGKGKPKPKKTKPKDGPKGVIGSGDDEDDDDDHDDSDPDDSDHDDSDHDDSDHDDSDHDSDD